VKKRIDYITFIIYQPYITICYKHYLKLSLCYLGAPDPGIIPTGNALRIMKSRQYKKNKRDVDTLKGLAMMKKEDDFKDILQDMGFDPFFIHYHCTEQIHIYRNYCKSVEHPRLVIDDTGSVIKNFSKFGFEKTRCLFVYEL